MATKVPMHKLPVATDSTKFSNQRTVAVAAFPAMTFLFGASQSRNGIVLVNTSPAETVFITKQQVVGTVTLNNAYPILPTQAISLSEIEGFNMQDEMYATATGAVLLGIYEGHKVPWVAAATFDHKGELTEKIY